MPGDVRVERAGLNPAGLGSSVPLEFPSPLSFFIKYRLCFVSFLNVPVGQIDLWSNAVEASGILLEMNLISCLQSHVQKLSLGAEIFLSCLSQAEMGVWRCAGVC